MSLRRLRRGEWVVVVALVALVVSLTLDWFSLPGADGDGNVYVLRGYGASSVSGTPTLDGGTGWTALGLPWSALVVVAGLAMVATVVQAARAGGGRPTYGALASVVIALPVTLAILLATAVRLLLATPAFSYRGGGIDGAFDGELATGSWVGLAGLLLGVVGLWVALADDRTSARDGVGPPAPREGTAGAAGGALTAALVGAELATPAAPTTATAAPDDPGRRRASTIGTA